jgi:ketosteroid isomerase-like protein
MSEQNVELVQRAFQWLQANDIDSFLTIVDPDVELHSLVLELEGTFRGRDGVREWWSNVHGVFPDWHPELVDVRDQGEWVIARGRFGGTGATSRVAVAGDIWLVLRWRDGKMVWYGAFRTETEALEAAGLRE